MELDLDFLSEGSAVRGRDLTAADVEKGTAPPVGALQRIRTRHHSLARSLAEGTRTDKQVAFEHGLTPQRLVQLKQDDNFVELIAHYARDLDAARADAFKRLQDLSLDAMDEIADRLEAEPESFTNKELRELSAMSLDRTGHGPSSNANVNVNVGFADKLQAATQRVAQQRTIDLTATCIEDAAE